MHLRISDPGSNLALKSTAYVWWLKVARVVQCLSAVHSCKWTLQHSDNCHMTLGQGMWIPWCPGEKREPARKANTVTRAARRRLVGKPRGPVAYVIMRRSPVSLGAPARNVASMCVGETRRAPTSCWSSASRVCSGAMLAIRLMLDQLDGAEAGASRS